ncbi:Sensor protein of zinc sigma-54-dependent two-component system [Klebsiella michiganensis]|uniref:Sensor protein of zinc sigma-54-dependent two-component system n=1 Tax=Klebsiella michiganensis TaxID=1134687 RepID=A0A7H4PDQ3_9ENTR|nr:Sensor protein of zinc sigma-54-dependent two-component system [Klebsiella michiganensis]
MNAMRLSKDSVAVWLSWLLTGLILLLVCLFSALIVRDYGRENEAARQTIQEKGSVLIRALESGAPGGHGNCVCIIPNCRRCWRRWPGSQACCGSL